MKMVEIPGGSVLLRDVEQVPERLVRPVRSAATRMTRLTAAVGELPADRADLTEDQLVAIAAKIPDDVMEDMWDLNDLLALAMVAEWRVVEPLDGAQPPVTLEALLELPKRQYDAVQKAVSPYLNDLMTDFSPSPEPDSPTEPSDASAGV